MNAVAVHMNKVSMYIENACTAPAVPGGQPQRLLRREGQCLVLPRSNRCSNCSANSCAKIPPKVASIENGTLDDESKNLRHLLHSLRASASATMARTAIRKMTNSAT